MTEITPFANKVYNYLLCIPAGRVTTYKNIAIAIGHPGASRAVGTALKNNPYAPLVPCHRVINSNFTIGSYMGENKSKIKEVILENEGIVIVNGKLLNRENVI